MTLKFDLRGFLDALGPRAEVAEFCGVSRTAPYGWLRRGYLNTTTMAKLLEFSRQKRLGLDIDKFFVREDS
jgi:hypothetical protein